MAPFGAFSEEPIAAHLAVADPPFHSDHGSAPQWKRHGLAHDDTIPSRLRLLGPFAILGPGPRLAGLPSRGAKWNNRLGP